MAGAEHPQGAFDAELDLGALGNLVSGISHIRIVFHEQMLARLDARGDDPEMAEILREVVTRGGLRLGKVAREVPALELWRADPAWPETLQERGRELADGAISDKPSKHVLERLEAGIPKAEVGLWTKALLSTVRRGKLVRQALKGILRR